MLSLRPCFALSSYFHWFLPLPLSLPFFPLPSNTFNILTVCTLVGVGLGSRLLSRSYCSTQSRVLLPPAHNTPLLFWALGGGGRRGHTPQRSGLTPSSAFSDHSCRARRTIPGSARCQARGLPAALRSRHLTTLSRFTATNSKGERAGSQELNVLSATLLFISGAMPHTKPTV